MKTVEQKDDGIATRGRNRVTQNVGLSPIKRVTRQSLKASASQDLKRKATPMKEQVVRKKRKYTKRAKPKKKTKGQKQQKQKQREIEKKLEAEKQRELEEQEALEDSQPLNQLKALREIQKTKQSEMPNEKELEHALTKEQAPEQASGNEQNVEQANAQDQVEPEPIAQQMEQKQPEAEISMAAEKPDVTQEESKQANKKVKPKRGSPKKAAPQKATPNNETPIAETVEKVPAKRAPSKRAPPKRVAAKRAPAKKAPAKPTKGRVSKASTQKHTAKATVEKIVELISDEVNSDSVAPCDSVVEQEETQVSILQQKTTSDTITKPEVFKKNHAIQCTRMPSNTDDELFFNMLRPNVQQMTERQFIFFQKKVLRSLMEILDDDASYPLPGKIHVSNFNYSSEPDNPPTTEMILNRQLSSFLRAAKMVPRLKNSEAIESTNSKAVVGVQQQQPDQPPQPPNSIQKTHYIKSSFMTPAIKVADLRTGGTKTVHLAMKGPIGVRSDIFRTPQNIPGLITLGPQRYIRTAGQANNRSITSTTTTTSTSSTTAAVTAAATAAIAKANSTMQVVNSIMRSSARSNSELAMQRRLITANNLNFMIRSDAPQSALKRTIIGARNPSGLGTITAGVNTFGNSKLAAAAAAGAANARANAILANKATGTSTSAYSRTANAYGTAPSNISTDPLCIFPANTFMTAAGTSTNSGMHTSAKAASSVAKSASTATRAIATIAKAIPTSAAATITKAVSTSAAATITQAIPSSAAATIAKAVSTSAVATITKAVPTSAAATIAKAASTSMAPVAVTSIAITVTTTTAITTTAITTTTTAITTTAITTNTTTVASASASPTSTTTVAMADTQTVKDHTPKLGEFEFASANVVPQHSLTTRPMSPLGSSTSSVTSTSSPLILKSDAEILGNGMPVQCSKAHSGVDALAIPGDDSNLAQFIEDTIEIL